MTSVMDIARSAWPELAVDPEAFARHIARHSVSAEPVALPDLYLAFASGSGSAAAIAAFERAYLPRARAAAESILGAGAGVDDVLARLREELLAGRDGGEPKILSYSGAGELGAWLQVAATRMALRHRGVERRNVSLEWEQVAAGDVEADYIKRAYREPFAAALAAAARALTPKQRNLLRYSTLDGLSGEQLAQLYAVHRATVVRWLADARDALVDGTRRELMQRLGTTAVEADSLMQFIHSQLDVSLRLLFGETSADVNAG